MPLRVEGMLEVLIEDHPKLSRTRHFLKTDKDRLELDFKGKLPSAATTGTRLRVTGRQSGNLLLLSSTDSTSVAVVSAPPLTNALGEQKAVVLLVNFLDDASQPFTVAQSDDVVFAQSSAFLRANSFQKTWLTGNSFGWFTLPIGKTCDGFSIASHAKQAASSAGIDLSPYARFIYVLPSNSACGWSGQAMVGGAVSNLWVNGNLSLPVVGHELGHNLGLYHSHSLDCGSTTLGASCTSAEYGDMVDMMGSNAPAHFNAFQKERLGWLTSAAQPLIASVQSSGTYSIDAYAGPGIYPKALKIAKSTDPVTGARTWYYVEYRQPVDFDAVMSAFSGTNYLSGLLVRTGSDTDANSSQLLDMTPASATFDWGDPALVFGHTFNDTASGVAITALAGYGSHATVAVTLGPATGCNRGLPSARLSGGAEPVAAGTQQSYVVSVTNNDSVGCGASTFNFKASVPTGWSSGFGNGSMGLAPGASATTTLSVASAAAASSGAYPIGADVVNAADAQYAVSASGSYAVAAAFSASVSTSRATYAVRDTVGATAKVFAGSAPVANANVTFVFGRPDGSTIVKSAVTDAAGLAAVGYRTSRRDPVGSWQVRGTASQGTAQASATAGFTLQ
jgi:Gametolysin peptidase M11/NPCBM-associated, NEW3 domain of alpha-galactosidase